MGVYYGRELDFELTSLGLLLIAGDNNGRVATPTGRALNDSISRPSVDSLLDELSNAHNGQPIYATING